MFINRYIANEELVSLLSNSITVVCPYIDATQSGVIMSAYALNKPVIATNVGGLPEMVDDGRYGFLVPPKDSQALERAIRQMIQPGVARQMSENIANDYSAGSRAWHSIASEMQEIYNTIINKRK
jgi:glycosyltransferase involved in cell wall biosynthesis